MSEAKYLHGYDQSEQERLVAQAEYFRHSLIRRRLRYLPGQSVLEIGCGAGAVLGVLADEFPGLRWTGIDREAAQIAFAKEHLTQLGLGEAELRVGDASDLPWPDASFDHVYAMWFVEHLSDPLPILREARRVLKPGGSITLTETDYTTFRSHPTNDDFDVLCQAQYDFYAAYGQPYAGRRLGAWLSEAGFEHVTNDPLGFQFFRGSESDTKRLRDHAEYNIGFLEPAVPAMVEAVGADEARLRRGLDHLRTLADQPGAALSQIVFRAQGLVPSS